MANLFWLGGTGANVAMAYARMQYLGLIPIDRSNSRHFFIDSPENFGRTDEVEHYDRNVGVNALMTLLKFQEGSQIFKLVPPSYKNFQEFLNIHPKMGIFYQGIEDYCGTDIGTIPVKHGNYYIPTIASAITHTQSESLEKMRTNEQNSIICSSSYGGTGAGVGPFLASYLLEQGHIVKIIHLNHWLIDESKKEVKRIIQHNEVANSFYIGSLRQNLEERNLADNLKHFLFHVPEGWQQQTPPGQNSNTTQEVSNPYPYFVATHIHRLLTPAPGIEYPDGIFKVSIDPRMMENNPAFMYAYAYTRLCALTKEGPFREFDFVLQLMNSKLPYWGLSQIRWEKSFFLNMRDKWYGDEIRRNEALRAIKTRLDSKKAGYVLNWPGFQVKEIDPPVVDAPPIRLLSYPTVFASYFYFLSHLEESHNTEFQEAYLALVALVITKRVYAEIDTDVDSLNYDKVTGAMPFSLSDKTEVLGYVAKKGVYVWPLLKHLKELQNRLRTDNTLQQALRTIHEMTSEQLPWQEDDPLAQALRSWAGTNVTGEQQRSVWTNLSLFQEIKSISGKEFATNHQYKVSQIIAPHQGENCDIIFHLQEADNGISVPANQYNLFVIDNPGNGLKILQYTNVLKNGYSKKIFRKKEIAQKLILNYRTILDLSEVKNENYEVEILHPRHILANHTFEFSLVEDSAIGKSVVPWPLRKNYVSCLKPLEGWHSDTNVNYPTLTGEFVDMRPHRIKNWGVVTEVDPINASEFMVKLHSTLFGESNAKVRQSEASYQGYIWPCDFQTKRLLKDWKYYSIMVTAAPETIILANEVATTITNDSSTVQEQWFFYQEDWQQLKTIRPDIHIGICQGNPPKAIALEYFDKNAALYYGAYFPIMPATTKNFDNAQATLGIDFGTSNTCAAVDIGINTENTTIQMNPSELLYPIFASHLWQTNDLLDFGWVPYFSMPRSGLVRGTAKIFPTGLCRFKEAVWERIELHLQDDGTLQFNASNNEPHLPLVDFTIPGDKLKEQVRNAVTVYNLKWEPNDKRKLIYWKDFLTTYLLFLSAHLFMGSQFKHTRFNTLNVKTTIPLKFSQTPVKVDNLDFSNMEDAFKTVLASAVKDVSQLTGLSLTLNNKTAFSYEAVAPLRADWQLLNNRTGSLLVVIDVGGGTTDVAVLKGTTCISTSSFVFAGNNPFGETFGEDYMTAQISLRNRSDNKREGTITGTQELHRFLDLIAAYTALLTGAAILQTDWKADKIGDIKICLYGQGWHLAQFHGDIHGKPNADYVEEIIKEHILAIFNDKVRPELGENGQQYAKLDKNNISIRKNATQSKVSCSLGAIEARSINVENAREMTFVGISSNSENGIKWHEKACDKEIRHKETIALEAVCPNLLLEKGALKLLLEDNWDNMNSMLDLFVNGFLKRNYVEYLLETEIGGYDPTQKGNVKMKLDIINKDILPAPDSKPNQNVADDIGIPNEND